MKLKGYLSTVILLVGLSLNPGHLNAGPYQKMDVHLIDVGQGDSILIKTPNEKNILIDGGPPTSGKKVVSYLNKQGIKDIDLMIATHPHIDHIGGLPDVMKEFKVKKIIDTGKVHPTLTYVKYINQILKQKIPIEIAQKDKQIELDPSLNIKILNAHERMKNNNQSSIVLKISYDKINFLFLSDIEVDQEKLLFESYNVEAEFVKIAHHGSKTSSSLEFLQHVDPQVALLTYSKHNKYGHPVDHVIENLDTIDSHIYSTAVFGNVVIYTNGKDYLILPERSPMDDLFNQVN